MGIEDDVKEILDDHGNRIQKLEVGSEIMKERWNNITAQLTRIENQSLSTNNTLLASNNSMLQTMNKLVDGSITTNTNKKDMVIKGITIGGSIIGLLILGYFALRGISVSIPVF